MGAAQKFRHGDLVRIADDLGPSKAHFEQGCDAIIDYSYLEKYGEGSREQYGLIFPKDGSQSAWYQVEELTFIKHVGQEGIDAVMAARAIREASQTDLAWIVANWKGIRKNVPGATMTALMKRIGIENPWGSRGEGVDLYANMRATWDLLDPVLNSGDIRLVELFLKEQGWRK